MKKILLATVFALSVAGLADAQEYRTSYFMEGSTFRLRMNPALAPHRGYIDIPALGNVTVNFNSSFTLNNMLYRRGGNLVTAFDPSVTWEELSGHLRDRNSLDVNVNTSILGFGFHSGRSFWSFDFGVNTETGLEIPYEMFEFIKTGPDGNAGVYDMGGVSVGAKAYYNTSIGYARKVNDALTVGGRVNFLAGIARADVTVDRLAFLFDDNGAWVGTDATVRADLRGRGLSIGEDEDNPGHIDPADIDYQFEGSNITDIAGFGITVDLGAEYRFMEQFKVSAAINNLGFMSWSSKYAQVGSSQAEFRYGGFDVAFEDGHWTERGDGFDFKDLETVISPELVDNPGRGKGKVRPTVILGGEYDIFGDNTLGAGLLFVNRRTDYTTRTEVAVNATYRPVEWFTASLSYSVGNRRNIGDNFFNSLGAAVNVHTNWINFFMGSDYMLSRRNAQFVPVGQKAFNFYMGLSIPLRQSRYFRWR